MRAGRYQNGTDVLDKPHHATYPWTMTTEMVTSSIKLPADLSRQLKSIAEADHRSLQATMVAALEAFAASRTHRAKVAAIGDRIATEHAEILARLA